MYQRLHGSFLVAGLLAVSGPHALGQEVETDAPLILPDLVVTGELQERTVQDSQTSVVILPGAELDQRDDFDLYDIIERTPNVVGSGGEKGFSIRGIDQRGPASGGTGLLINTQIDGASLPTVFSAIFGPYSTWDLEQVEILRGPQSTQQGRNALAGAVVIRSADPTYDFEFKGRGELGNRDTIGGALAVNVPLIDDMAAVRFSFERAQTDGFIDNPVRDTNEYDAREQTTLRAKARLDPTEDFSSILSLSYAENFGGEDFIEASLFPGERINLSDVEGQEGSDHLIGNLRMTYDIAEDLVLSSETSYYDGAYVRLEDADLSPADEGLFDLGVDSESISQEVRLNYEGDRWRGVIGGFFTSIETVDTADSRLTDDFFSDIIPPGTELVFPQILDLEVTSSTRGVTETQNYAVFGEVEYRVLPDLGLIAGGRFDRERQRFTSSSTTDINITFPPGAFPVPDDETLSVESTYSAFLPKAGAVYDWTDTLSTGFTVQRAYRAGGAEVNGFTREVNEFDPEFAWNYELSLRSQWFGGRLTANANAFYTSWRDQQLTVQGDSGSSIDSNTINAGRSRLFGGELTLDAQPTDSLRLFGSLGLVRTEFLEFVDLGQDFAGNEFPGASPVTAAFGASYFFDNGFELHGDASYTGGAFSDLENSDETRSDSRFLINLRAGFQQDTWAAFLYIRNLLDNDYRLAQTLRNGNLIRVGEPFTVGGIVTFNF